MPTGYTYKIEEGCSFEEFVWTCARAFGACLDMRDDPMDAPIPEQFQVSDHYEKRLRELEDELTALDAMSDDEVQSAIAAERAEVIAANQRCAEEHERLKTAYKAIRDRVEAWNPPSDDHVGLKNFMLEQIDISTPSHLYQRDLPPKHTWDWLHKKRSGIRRDIMYYTKEHHRNVERIQQNNNWIAMLRDSIPQPEITS